MAVKATRLNADSPVQDSIVADSEYLVSLDGRIDNRQELELELGLKPGGIQSDAELIREAYRKWTRNAPQHLIGDYAFSIWDQQEQLLVLSRDPFGTRPLFYYYDGKNAVWSSDIAELTKSVNRGDLEEEFIAGYLTLTEDSAVTPYKQILSVPPGAVIAIQRASCRTFQIWNGTPVQGVNYRQDSDYEEHFRELLKNAIICRFRTRQPVMCELSGGLDSSSIVCLADELFAAGRISAARINTLTFIFDLSRTSDESAFSDLVEQKRKRTGYHIRESRYPMFQPFSGSKTFAVPNPLQCFAGTMQGIKDAMRHSGAGVLVSGQGGDHLFVHDGSYIVWLCDLLIQGRFRDLFRSLRGWNKTTQDPYLKLILDGIVLPLIEHLSGSHSENATTEDLLNPAFNSHMNCRERILKQSRFGFGGGLSKARQYRMLANAISSVSPCFERQCIGVEKTYPFLDKRLVEFMLAIDMDQISRPEESRSLQRRAVRTTVPGRICRRKGKGSTEEAICRGLDRSWDFYEKLLRDPLVSEMGYIKGDRFRARVELARHGMSNDLPYLIRALSLEMWLRQTFAEGSFPNCAGPGEGAPQFAAAEK